MQSTIGNSKNYALINNKTADFHYGGLNLKQTFGIVEFDNLRCKHLEFGA